MNEKKTYQKALPALGLVLALLCLAGTALGAWYARSQTTNKITTGSLKGLLIDEYEQDTVLNPGLSADKVVKVENTGEVASIVRIRVEKAWGSSRDADQVLQVTAEDRLLSTDNILISYNTSDWHYDSDGDWHYYKAALEPDDVSEPLFTEFTIDPATTNAYKNKYADIKVTMECIQAGGNALEDYWQQDFTELGIDYDSTRRVIRTYVEFADPDGGDDAFLFKTEADDGDLFAMFKNLVPGEFRSQEVEVSNTWEEDVYLYFRALVTEQEQATAETEALIEKMLQEYVTITVTEQGSGEELYRGPVWGNLVETAAGTDTMKDLIPLGSFVPEESRELLVSLYADPAMDNDYQQLEGWIDWEFVALDEILPIAPEKYITDSELDTDGKGNPGDQITYQIKYFNHELQPVRVLIADELDDNVKFKDASQPYTYDEKKHTVSWTVEDVPAAVSGYVDVTVEILDDALEAGNITNDASVKIGNNTAVDTKPIITPVEEPEEPELPDDPKKPEKEVAEESQVKADAIAYPGQQITYNIRYYNHETGTAEVKIWDELDPNVEYVTSSHGGICENGIVSWTIAEAASKEWGYVSVTVKVLDSALLIGKVENQAEVQIGNSSSQKTDIIEHKVEEPPTDPQKPEKTYAPDSAVKTGDQVNAGDIITYQIDFYNHHGEPADVIITDELDPGVDFEGASDGGIYDAETGIVTWILEKVGRRTYGSVNLTVKVNDQAEVKVDNQAVVKIGTNNEVKTSVVTNEVEKPVDPGTSDDPKKPEKEVAEESQVKADAIAYPGQQITYNIRYYNHESETAEVEIWDELDPNVEYVTSSHGGTCENGIVSWTIPAAASKEWGYVSVTVKVLDSAVLTGKVENQAEVQIGGSSSQKTNIIEHKVEEPPIDPQKPEKTYAPDSAVKTGDQVKTGDLISYQINFYNHHNEPADIIITDELDPGVDFEEASDGGSYDPKTGIVSWTIKEVGRRTYGSVTLTVKVNDQAEVKVDNQAAVKIGTDSAVKTSVVTNEIEEPVNPGNPDEPKDPKKEVAEESQVKADAVAYPGQRITYHIRYYNHEAETAEVQILDELDSNVEFVTASAGGTCEDGVVSWTIPEAASKEWGYVSVTVIVRDDAIIVGKVSNQAEVQIGNNSSQKTNTIEHTVEEPPADPQDPEKTYAPDSDIKTGDKVKSGDVITYQINFYNHHNEPADVIITDELDPGVSFEAASDGGSYDPAAGVVSWTIENVGRRTYGSVELTVKVNEQAEVQVDNQAVVKVGTNPEVKTSVVTNEIEKPVIPGKPDEPQNPEKEVAEDSQVKADATAYPGQQITYNIRYYNHELEAAEVKVWDELDSNVEFISANAGGTYENGVVSWAIPNAASKEWGTVSVTVKVLEEAVKVGSVENQAEVQIGSNSRQITNVVEHKVEKEPDQTGQTEPATEPADPANPNPTVPVGSKAKTFKKTPVTDNAAIGGTVDYIFSDFDNELSRSMKRYSITDIFPEGLLFESASLPAFTKGENLTYTISYITNGQERKDLHTDVDAGNAFSFKAPDLAEGEWMMYLTIAFDEVPAGFGEGDTILFTCRVADDVKEGDTLINEAALGYDGLGIAGENKGVKINGRTGNGSRVKTSDEMEPVVTILLAFMALSAGIALYIVRTKKKKQR